MEKLKKIILLIAGPGILALELVVIFIHLFTSANTKPIIIIGLVIFFVGFIPLYSVEYFRQNFKDEPPSRIVRFKKSNKRHGWEGGNIHGKTPTKSTQPGKLFNKNDN